MTPTEFSDQFDVLYNNITSNQAPGLTEYEKVVFLNKGMDEVIKNHVTANSKGNTIGQGFDDSAKRQADFSALMKVLSTTYNAPVGNVAKIDSRSLLFPFPDDAFIVIHETINYKSREYQVIPIRFDDYVRVMSKPFRRPTKNQAWRLLSNGSVSGSTYTRQVEIITTPEVKTDQPLKYIVRYIRRPKPIITGDLDGLTINGYYLTGTTAVSGATPWTGECELDPILHEEILQRAVELAKVAWTQTGQDNTNAVLAAGQRSE